MSNPLDEDALLQAAAKQIPDADFGDDDFRPALRQLLAALRDEAQLDGRGVWATVTRLMASLGRRRRLSQLLRRQPEIVDQPLPAPIFILGFPRTGTTLLHNLMAADPGKRAIRLWEMREPFAPEHAGPEWVEQTIATTRQLVAAGYQLSPRLADIHPLRPTWPDECSWLLRNSFTSMVLGFSHFVPSYVRWLLDQDLDWAYAYFRLQLQAIVHQRPGAPLVLKDPCHIWHLDALLHNFPDARIVHLHRDLAEVLPSFCSLQRALHEGGAQPRPDAEIGAYAEDMLAAAMDRMLEVRAGLAEDRVLDLDYRQLVRAPVETVAAIHARFGLELGEQARADMRAWLDANRSLSGRHRYSLAMFGREPDAVRDRFAPYAARFSSLLT